jgi:hypothetical protein
MGYMEKPVDKIMQTMFYYESIQIKPGNAGYV